MVWEGLNVVKTGSVMLREINPADSKNLETSGVFSALKWGGTSSMAETLWTAQIKRSASCLSLEPVAYKSCVQNWIYCMNKPSEPLISAYLTGPVIH